ncbi:unnamed protein product [Miscanthus lutarioriparius]|uniref:Cation efflux protein cytoplasmic domain-containing protein n=1 Tax=Miscanthus lutarioriparius TaxID=422564 RepID=A0A811S8F7_9POAL|nr:unnamed protein product [Miscanthus lutarioriparius]
MGSLKVPDSSRLPPIYRYYGGRRPEGPAARFRLRRRDSARSLCSTFMSRLPDKVHAGLNPERLADLDLSRAKGLSQGVRDANVDIELSEDMRLREAHTIGESLQEKIEKLPEVERAFVHIDFESTHNPEHKVRSRLPSTDP